MLSQKDYRYRKGLSEETDRAFVQAEPFGNVRFSRDFLFWRRGIFWYVISSDQPKRIYRRVEAVDAKMCCGGASFDMEKLVILLKEGEKIEIRIGDGVEKEAKSLFAAIQDNWKGIAYGKP